MRHIFFFDLPVYRLEKDKYYSQMDKWIKTKLGATGNPIQEEIIKKYPEEKIRIGDNYRKIYGGAWEYNEIIGFIRLHFWGTQIRGEYWQHKAIKMMRTRRKQYEYVTHKLAVENNLPLIKPNREIYNKIMEYIHRCKKELKNRYIDISIFETIGPYINWRKLIKDEDKAPIKKR
jgi:hypothetical protein